MKTKITKIILIICLFVFSFFSFNSIHRAVTIPDSSIWLVPIGWFSAFLVAIFIMPVFIREKKQIIPLIAFILTINLFFSFEPIRLIIYGVGCLLAVEGVNNILRDFEFNIRFSLKKSLMTGKTLIILGMAIIIAGQYYSEVKKYDVKNPPKLKTEKFVGMIAPKILAMINPEFKDIQEGGVTVNQFILSTQKNQLDLLEKLPPVQRAEGERLILEIGRSQLSDLYGQKLDGNENMAGVFSKAIDIKLDDFISTNFEKSDSLPVLPLIFALILLLMIMPLGNMLSWAWILIALGIFKIFLYFRIIRLEKAIVEVERLA